MAALTRRLALAGAASAALPAGAQPSMVLVGRDGWLFAAWEDARRGPTPAQRAALDVMNQACAAFARADVQLALTLAPMRARLYPEMLPAELRPTPAFERNYAALRDAMRGMAPAVPDLAEQFGGLRGSQREALFFKADSHWTGTGAEAAAQSAAALLAPRLPAPPGTGTRLGAIETRMQQQPDLAALLPEAQRRAYGPEAFRAHRVQAAGLTDTARSDLAVVGNSFMAPFLGFAPMFSNRLNRPVTLSWLTARNGPWHTMLEYLRGPFRTERPRAILWHFMEATIEAGPDAAGVWGAERAMQPARFLSDLRSALG